MKEKRIGKIQSITIGSGGYQDAMWGVSFYLGSDKDCWGCGDFWGVWGPEMIPGKNHKWTEKERQEEVSKTFWRLAKLMEDAKVNDFNKLKGIPVEVVFECNVRSDWRILTEVL